MTPEKFDYHPMPVAAQTLPHHQCSCEGCNVAEPAYVYCALCDSWWCAFHFASLHYPPHLDSGSGEIISVQTWSTI